LRLQASFQLDGGHKIAMQPRW